MLSYPLIIAFLDRLSPVSISWAQTEDPGRLRDRVRGHQGADVGADPLRRRRRLGAARGRHRQSHSAARWTAVAVDKVRMWQSWVRLPYVVNLINHFRIVTYNSRLLTRRLYSVFYNYRAVFIRLVTMLSTILGLTEAIRIGNSECNQVSALFLLLQN